MPRKSNNYAPVDIPTNVSVSNGYVYYNLTTEWVSGKINPDKKRADHKKRLIGKAVLGNGDWKNDRRMIPNNTYFQLFEKEHAGVVDKDIRQDLQLSGAPVVQFVGGIREGQVLETGGYFHRSGCTQLFPGGRKFILPVTHQD